MLETLTIKFPSSLMKKIKEKSQQKKISRGAFVRETVMHYFDSSSSDVDDFDFKAVTKDLLEGKRKKHKVSIVDEIRKKLASQPQPKLSPEEEVRLSRTRGFLP